MPSVLTTNQSGGQYIMSGLQWSGFHQVPIGSLQLLWDPNASGNAYVALSGGVTIRSGGLMDGFPLVPGASYQIPKLGAQTSGNIQVTFSADAACSGQAFMFYQPY